MKKIITTGAILGTLLFAGEAAADYTVKPGDTLYKISQNTNVSVNTILSSNPTVKDASKIYPGQVLKMPTSNSTTTSSETGTYVIKSGDTLSAIAARNGITLSQLLNANPEIQNTSLIRVGQVIKIPGTTSTSTSQEPAQNATQETSTYIVKSGDTFSSIAKKYSLTQSGLLSLNPDIKDANKIFVGQSIKVPSQGTTSNPAPTPTESISSWEQKADAVIAEGKKYIGAPYVYGASTSRTDAFDCSSFTFKAFQAAGITLPRTSLQQSSVGKQVALSDVRKGDLLFFDTDYDGVINHVSIVIDKSTILHAATSKGVSIATMNTYWNPRFVKAMRIIQ